MFDFHEKRKIRSFFYSKPFIGALFLVAVFMSFTVYNRYVVAKEMRTKLDTHRAELEELRQRAQLLESKVEYMKDARGIEEELRTRFDVAKEGEQVVILIDSEPVTQNGESNEEEDIAIPKKKWFSDFFKF